jgi:hypothetical protein
MDVADEISIENAPLYTIAEGTYGLAIKYPDGWRRLLPNRKIIPDERINTETERYLTRLLGSDGSKQFLSYSRKPKHRPALID